MNEAPEHEVVIAMMWSGNGSWAGGGWWWFGGIFMLFCMWMMFRMMSHGHHSSHGHHGFDTGYPRERGSGRPDQILAERFARGEIDAEEYERRLAVLRRRSDGAETQGDRRLGRGETTRPAGGRS